MATIRERTNSKGESSYQVQIRTRKTKQTATFTSKHEAEIWALTFDVKSEAFESNLIERKFPTPPPPMLEFPIISDYIPQVSGIYFFWHKGKIVYVGKSINLRNRISYKNHHHLSTDYAISFITFHEVSDQKLSFIEAWFIGNYEPILNFTKPVKK